MTANDNNFQLVSRRKRGKRPPSGSGRSVTLLNSQELEFDPDHVLRKINAAVEELLVSEFKKRFFDNVNEALELLNADNVPEIVCYGLGHFAEYASSKYQLSCLMILKNHFQARVLVHDPIFWAGEIEILKTLGFEVISKNEEGKRRVAGRTFVYLPHCPKQLTNNFLYANWGPDLGNCIICSNSFSTILDSHTDRVLRNCTTYILDIAPHVTEIRVDNCFKYPDVFNDLALHVFIGENLKKVPAEIWDDREEPEYREEDIEFIANQIAESLNL